MTKCSFVFLAASSMAVIVASQPASAFTQLCAGPALTGVTGPITNGSSCNLEATGATATEVFVGVSAKDTDILSLGSTEIFNNQTATTSPVDVASQSVTKGDTLPFNLTNTNDPLSFLIGGGPPTFNAGTKYTNPALSFIVTQPELAGVYHFAWFDMTSASDVDALFGPKVTMPSSVDAYILSHGGYSDWTFVGVEEFEGYGKRRLERHDLRIPGRCARWLGRGRRRVNSSRAVNLGHDAGRLCRSRIFRLSRAQVRRGRPPSLIA